MAKDTYTPRPLANPARLAEPSELLLNCIDRFAIIRANDAGVHMGIVRSLDGRGVWLQESRRLWQWEGGNTLNEVALDGVDRSRVTRISEIVPDIVILDACEILPMSDKAVATIDPVWNE